MLIVDNTDVIPEWISRLNEDQLSFAKLDLVTFELSQGLNNELILIDVELFNSLSKTQLEKINQCKALVLFNIKDLEVKNPPENIVCIIESNTDRNILVKQLLNLEEFVKTNNQLKTQLISMNMELSEIIGGVENQLQRIKRSYERTAPKRLEEFQGFKIFSKYAAGEDMGGEFFDLFAKDQKIFIMMSKGSSYLASSSILQLFTELKSLPEICVDSEINFIKNVKEQVDTISKNQKKAVSAQLLTCILDINTLKIEGHVFGNFKSLSSNLKHNHEFSSSLEVDLEQAKFTQSIKRGERLMLCSPGFVMNWMSLAPKFMIEELLTNKKIKVLDILDEVYFQIKKESVNGFLKSDASSIIMEVEENVILQV